MSFQIQKILVAVDLSEITESVLDCAGELAKAHDAELEILHVAAPNPDFVGLEAGPQAVRDQRAEELRSEHRDLQDRAKQFQEDGVRATSHLVEGSTAAVILEHARKHESDLIAVGSHGHGALFSALMGSVSSAVVKDAACPVLIVPSRAGP